MRAGEVVPGAEFGEVVAEGLGRALLPQPRPQVLLQRAEEPFDPSVLPRSEGCRALMPDSEDEQAEAIHP